MRITHLLKHSVEIEAGKPGYEKKKRCKYRVTQKGKNSQQPLQGDTKEIRVYSIENTFAVITKQKKKLNFDATSRGEGRGGGGGNKGRMK